jgi:serine phosphatase RsbU (regulator of sigma subunit)
MNSPATPPATQSTLEHALECMEIWSGSHAVTHAISTPGLQGTVLSRPYQQAAEGGDIHYVSLCGGGAITRAILADVAGHGHSVAAVAHILRDLLRKNINTANQQSLVRALNTQFATLSSTAVFATALVVTYLAKRQLFTFCNAGHPRPLFFHAASNAWRLLSTDAGDGDLPLGIAPEIPYGQFALRTAPGDLLLLYTDYFIEARNSQGAALGEEGLLQLAASLPRGTPDELARNLLNAVDAYRDHAPPDDDTTLLVLARTPARRRPYRPAERLRAWGKIFHLLPV